jgi:hypothetical protein
LDYPGTSAAAARARVQLPAIFLIVLGLLNLLGAGFGAFMAVRSAQIPPDEVERAMEQRDPKGWEQAKAEGYTAEKVLAWFIYGGWGTAAVNLLTTLVLIWGGARMLQLRSYGLSVFASVLAALPCISASACCGLGEIVGLWAVIVLLKPEVREAFR